MYRNQTAMADAAWHGANRSNADSVEWNLPLGHCYYFTLAKYVSYCPS